MLVTSISNDDIRDLAKLTRDWNIAPIFLPGEAVSDRSNPVSKMFMRLSDRVFAEMASLSPAQREEVLAEIPADYRFLADHAQRRNDETENLRSAANYYVVAQVSPKHFDIEPAVCPNSHADVVLSEYPELSSSFDKDGLLILDERFELLPGGIRYKNHVLHFHQLLRRGYHSNPNSDLIDTLAKVRNGRSPPKLRLAVDRSRLMPSEAYREILERDYWWGPKYDESRLDDLGFVGMSVIKRREGTVLERLFAPIERTEVFWYQRDKIKTLEMEEISRPNAEVQTYLLNRYVHAERDPSLGEFRHLDGAVKIYPNARYGDRLLAKLSDRPKAPIKPKLFRLDGSIKTDQAVDIICQFYRSNEMVIEYFNPDEFTKIFGKWNVPWPATSAA